MITLSVFYHFLTVVSLLTETLLGYIMMGKILTLRRFRGCFFCISVFYAIHAALLLAEEYLITAQIGDAYPVYLCLHCSLFILYSFLLCSGRPVFKIFLPLIYVSAITLCRFPVSLILQLIRPFMPGNIMFFLQHLANTLGSTSLLLLLTLFFLHYRPDTQQDYPFSYYIVMIATPLLNMMSFTLLKNYYSSISDVIYWIGTFSLLIELLIYYMTWQSTGEYAKRIQFQLISQQKDYQNQHMEELNSIVTEYHHLRHDTKNHFACMDRLLSQNKYDSLKEYFYTLSKEIYALDNQIETGNEIVNQVINIKYATAHKLNIPMDIRIALPHTLNLPDHLLCSLTSNLLDNAIEASQKISDPEIIIEMKMVKSYLSLTIRNRIEEQMQESSLNVKTTKPDKKRHGLGREIIQDIVRRYNGIYTKEAKNGWYMASVMLELPE